MHENNSEIQMNLFGNSLILSFDYDAPSGPAVKDRIKSISGAWFNKELRRWEIPISQYDQVVTLENLKISKGVIDRLIRDADLVRKVKELKKAEYVELFDYSPKLALMSHQKKAFEVHRLLGCSADFSQQGSGKSAPAICITHWRKITGKIQRCLVICPKSIIGGWEEQLTMFSDLSFISLKGNKLQRLERLEKDRDVYIINYEGSRIMIDELLAREFDMVICDEAHRLKDSTTLQSQAAYILGEKAQYRIAMTGQPVANSSLDCFGILKFVRPDIFGPSFFIFRNKYFKNVMEGKSSIVPIYIPRAGAEEIISEKLGSISVRVLKEECLDLPPFTFMERQVTLTAEQDAAYEKMQKELLIELGQQKKVKISHILTALMKLNQITSGHLRVPDTKEIIQYTPNPKLEELKDLFNEISGPTIIWAYYKVDMRLIYDTFSRCRKCKNLVNDISDIHCSCGAPISYRASIVDGSTKDRDFQIARFRFTPKERAEMRAKKVALGESPKNIKNEFGELLPNGEEKPQTNIIVNQLQAASEGLNLQISSTAIFYSRTYSILQYSQALARNHRAGQKNNVTYINLVSCRADGSDTVDQKVLQALQRKENLARKINKDDIKMMLGNYKKKDREALKNVVENIEIDFDIDEQKAEELIKKLEINNNEVSANDGTSEVKQKTLF